AIAKHPGRVVLRMARVLEVLRGRLKLNHAGQAIRIVGPLSSTADHIQLSGVDHERVELHLQSLLYPAESSVPQTDQPLLKYRVHSCGESFWGLRQNIPAARNDMDLPADVPQELLVLCSQSGEHLIPRLSQFMLVVGAREYASERGTKRHRECPRTTLLTPTSYLPRFIGVKLELRGPRPLAASNPGHVLLE